MRKRSNRFILPSINQLDSKTSDLPSSGETEISFNSKFSLRNLDKLAFFMYQGLISNLFRIASGAGFCSSTRRDPPPRSYVMMIDIPRRTVAVNAYFGWCRIECVLPRSKYHFLLSRLQPGYYPVYKQLDINLIFRIIPPRNHEFVNRIYHRWLVTVLISSLLK